MTHSGIDGRFEKSFMALITWLGGDSDSA